MLTARRLESFRSSGGRPMIRRALAPACVLVLVAGLLSSAPRAQDARLGATLYTERCATCHGADAKGQVGPSLTTLWASGASDDRIFETIRRGVPGSVMPPSDAPEA